MDPILLPSYSDGELPTLELQDEPPTYEPRLSPPPVADRTEYLYSLFTRKGKPWITLQLLGNGLLSKQVPSFIEGEPIAGSVSLSLESKDSIQSIIISIQGRLITGAQDRQSFVFVHETLQLWSRAMGNPTAPEAEFDGKLQGDHRWPFSIKLPLEVYLSHSAKALPQRFRLPSSLLERRTRVSVQYDLSVILARGKLRADSRLESKFGYMILTKPGPPSLLRQLAYQENSELLGPEADPVGWRTSASVRINGSIFDQRDVDATCKLSLAEPLSYTRGSVISCVLVIESKDVQALDLLSTPTAMRIRLMRYTRYHETGGQTGDGQKWRDVTEHVDSAVWWPCEGGGVDHSSRKRQLNGEVRLKKNLAASMAIGQFRIEYAIEVHPFDTTAFTPRDKGSLLTEPVEIVTAYATGPRPKSYAPSDLVSHDPPMVDLERNEFFVSSGFN